MSAEYTIDLTFTFEIISQQSLLRHPISTFMFSTMHRTQFISNIRNSVGIWHEITLPFQPSYKPCLGEVTREMVNKDGIDSFSREKG